MNVLLLHLDGKIPNLALMATFRSTCGRCCYHEEVDENCRKVGDKRMVQKCCRCGHVKALLA